MDGIDGREQTEHQRLQTNRGQRGGVDERADAEDDAPEGDVGERQHAHQRTANHEGEHARYTEEPPRAEQQQKSQVAPTV